MLAATIKEYLEGLPADRRAAITAVRKAIDGSLPAGYQSGMQFGMIGWFVPLTTYPAGYGGNAKVPLPYLGLVSQKSHMALHLMCLYCHPTLRPWFDAAYAKSGKKLDMGQGCLRFKTLDDLALDVVTRTIARVTPEEHAANYQATRDALKKGKAKAPTAKAALKKGKAKAPAAARKAKPKK